MELRQLRYYVAVAEERSFTRAAERLHIAQPALSVQVRRLEDELGVSLLDRSRRAIALTEPGALLLDEARRLLAALDQAVDLVRRTAAGEVGRLSVGFVPSASNDVLPPLLRRFTAARPGVAIHLREMAPDDLVDALHERRLDVAFLYLPFDDPSLAQRVAGREGFVAALPADHSLVGEESIDVATLRDEPFVLPARHEMPGLHAQVLDLCREAGFVPRAVQDDVWLVQTIVALVAAGVGVAIVPASAAALRRRGVVLRPLRTHRQHEVELAAVWRRDDRSPLVGAFIDELGDTERTSCSVRATRTTA
jgi:DNA-binding transcriptional LysR family regulator